MVFCQRHVKFAPIAPDNSRKTDRSYPASPSSSAIVQDRRLGHRSKMGGSEMTSIYRTFSEVTFSKVTPWTPARNANQCAGLLDTIQAGRPKEAMTEITRTTALLHEPSVEFKKGRGLGGLSHVRQPARDVDGLLKLLGKLIQDVSQAFPHQKYSKKTLRSSPDKCLQNPPQRQPCWALLRRRRRVTFTIAGCNVNP